MRCDPPTHRPHASMHSHSNARLTQKGRLRLVTQHQEHGRSLSELAAENGISLRCAYRWLARYSSGGAPGPTRQEPTARPRDSSRRPARNGHTPWRFKTLRSETASYPATCRSITASGSTRPWAGAHLSSGSLSCSADEPGKTQHLAAVPLVYDVYL